MALVIFTVDVALTAPPQTAWQALIDWQGHGDWVPATRVRVTHAADGPGTRFVARTGFGALAFDDSMTVEAVDHATHRAAVVKHGPLLTGTAHFVVTPAGSGCVVTWHEEVRVRGCPQFLAPLLRTASRTAFRHALGRLDAQLG